MRQTFMQAVQAFQAGDLQRATALCEQILALDAGQVDALQLQGVVLFESGNADAARQSLDRALSLQPGNADIAFNYGNALLKIGDYEAAIAKFDLALTTNPGHFSALNNKGSACKSLGQTQAAEVAYQGVLRLQPNHAGAAHNLGNLAAEAGDHEKAERYNRRALSMQSDHAGSNFGLASALLAQGRYREAMDPAERAVRLVPDHFDYWSVLGNAYLGAERYDEAASAYKKAIEIEPDSADAWNNLGSALTSLERLEEAEKALKQALEIAPHHLLALGNLSALYELANRLEECEAIAQSGLQAHPGDVALTLSLAKCRHRQGSHEQAAQMLGSIVAEGLDPRLAKDIHFTLGQVLAKLDQPQAAFEQFKRGNQVSGDWWQAGRPEPDQFVPALKSIRNLITTEWCQSLPTDGGPSAAESPIFLLGFQRSGTTLLDTMLGAHGGVVVMEEQPMISRVIATMTEQFGRYPAGLTDLDTRSIEILRASYWEAVTDLSDWTNNDGRLLLDKSPLHTVHLGLIKLLFPEAPVILALRHPLDVCLSCFMQDFTMNSFMTHFLTVEGVAEVYDEVMGIWRLYRECMNFRHHQIRYEDLVENTEMELRTLLEFINLPWRDKVLDHVGHAHSRGLISTPSYHQVTQPVYKSARFRWLRYQDQLAPVIPVLQRHIEYFGYSAQLDTEAGND
jgi:tetratricopeptide (TPR) repeat protein